MPTFKLTLAKTYYDKGFFNVTVDFDRLARLTEGSVELVLGVTGRKITGKVSRRANKNGTARIRGGAKLRDWLQETYRQDDIIDVVLTSSGSIQLGPSATPARRAATDDDMGAGSAGPVVDLFVGEVSQPRGDAPPRDEQIAWFSKQLHQLNRLLDSIDPASEEQGVYDRVTRLRKAKRLPKDTASMILTFCTFRNDVVKELRPIDKEKWGIAQAIWSKIVDELGTVVARPKS